jgi:ABC-type lipoprotein release transport system permease subunit
MGKYTRQEVVHYEPLSQGFTDNLRQRFGDRSTLVPFAYRNIMTFYSPDLKIRYWFQFLYLHLNDLKPFMPELAEGRYPSENQREVLIGHQAARQWKLSVGDHFSYDSRRYIFDYVKPKTNSPYLYQVVGMLRRDLPFDFFGGSILIPMPAETERKRLFLPFNGTFIFQTNKSFSMDDINQEIFKNHLVPLFNRRSWTDLSNYSLMVVIAFLVLLANLGCAGSVYIQDNIKNIGLLKTFGMDNNQIAYIFIIGFLLLKLAGFLCGAGLASMVITILNKMYSKPYSYVYAYYQIPMEAYIFVVILLLVMAIGSTFYVLNRINRLAPADVLINSG